MSRGVFDKRERLASNQWFRHGWKTGLEFKEYMNIIFRLFKAVKRAAKLPSDIMTVGDFYDGISKGLNNIHFQLKISKADTISELKEFKDLYLLHSMKFKVQRSPLAFKSCAKKNIRLRLEGRDIYSSKSNRFHDMGAMLTVGNGSLADFKRKAAEDIKKFSERRILEGAENLTVKDQTKEKKRARMWKKELLVMRFLRFVWRKHGYHLVR